MTGGAGQHCWNRSLAAGIRTRTAAARSPAEALIDQVRHPSEIEDHQRRYLVRGLCPQSRRATSGAQAATNRARNGPTLTACGRGELEDPRQAPSKSEAGVEIIGVYRLQRRA